MIRTLRRYHFFYSRKGFYKFLGQISLKFAIFMAIIGAGLMLFEQLTPGVAHYFAEYSVMVSNEIVLIFFFISETLLGLVPPDLFIVWTKKFSSPYVFVTVLAILSYTAGLLSYVLGMRIVNLEKIREYIHVKFEKQFNMLRSWGGLIIVIAALLPLPYSTMCLGAGMLKYSFKSLMLLGAFRIVRFFAYALVLFQLV